MEQGGVWLWMWKVQFGVLLGFLVLWQQSGEWTCVSAEKPELRNLEKYEDFFPLVIENWKTIFDEKEGNDEAGNVQGASETGSKSEDPYGVIVRNRWKDTVDVKIENRYKNNRTLYTRHPVPRGPDWSYRIKDYSSKGRKTMAFILHKTQKNRILSFLVEEELSWGAAKALYSKTRPTVRVTKLLIDAEKKEKADAEKGGEEKEGDAEKIEDGDGILAAVYTVSGEHLQKKFLYHLQWKNIMPEVLDGDGGMHINIQRKYCDEWRYNNSDEDPTLMRKGLPRFVPARESKSLAKGVVFPPLKPKVQVQKPVHKLDELVSEKTKKRKEGGTS